MLLERGADASEKQVEGNTPLHSTSNNSTYCGALCGSASEMTPDSIRPCCAVAFGLGSVERPLLQNASAGLPRKGVLSGAIA